MDTSSLRAASAAQLRCIASAGRLVVPALVLYELLHQLGAGDVGAHRAAIHLNAVPFLVEHETIDLWRQAFGRPMLGGSLRSRTFGRLLVRMAAERTPTETIGIWRDLWRRGYVAFGPDALPDWKGPTGTDFIREIAELARWERGHAKQAVDDVVRAGTHAGRPPPERSLRRAMELWFHDELLESCWPMVRLLQQLAHAVGIEPVSPGALGLSDDDRGMGTFEGLARRYGYRGGLEFAFRAYTFLVDRHLFGHTGHRNDFVDVQIATSVRFGDVFVSEERWWEHYVGRHEVPTIHEAAERR